VRDIQTPEIDGIKMLTRLETKGIYVQSSLRRQENQDDLEFDCASRIRR
jgi:hypothetical protein